MEIRTTMKIKIYNGNKVPQHFYATTAITPHDSLYLLNGFIFI